MLLFAVTMPLKYWAEIGFPNKVAGYLHGVLFITYLILAMLFWFRRRLGISKLFWLIVASLLPFGTFYLDEFYLRPLSVKEGA